MKSKEVTPLDVLMRTGGRGIPSAKSALLKFTKEEQETLVEKYKSKNGVREFVHMVLNRPVSKKSEEKKQEGTGDKK